MGHGSKLNLWPRWDLQRPSQPPQKNHQGTAGEGHGPRFLVDEIQVVYNIS